MAERTPRRPARTRQTRPASGRAESGRLRDHASAWLSHPLAGSYLVIVPSAMLLVMGIVMVWSASSVISQTQFGDPYYFFKRELIFATLGIIVAIVMTRIPLERLKSLGWPIIAVAGVLMCVPFAMGKSIKGNLNWIDFGPMLRFQPSEFVKIALILWAGTLFTSKRKVLDDPLHLLVPFLPGALVLIGLTVLQHDLGTAIVIGLIVVALLWNVGASWKILGSIGAIVVVAVLGLVAATPYRVARIMGYLDPSVDPNGINYQPNQAQYGLATGGWWGVGLGFGRMKWGYLSEAHTDYILAVIGEELGLIGGTLLVILLFVLFVYGGFRVAVRANSFYARIVASGITAWIGTQALINISVVLRLIPVLGVPLPLVSYGGSSLVMECAALGILVRCSLEAGEAQDFLSSERRARAPHGTLSAVLSGHRPTASTKG